MIEEIIATPPTGGVHKQAAAIGLALRLNPQLLPQGLKMAGRWVFGLDACDRAEWRVQLSTAILDWEELVTEFSDGGMSPSAAELSVLLEARDDLESSAWLRRAAGLLDDEEEQLLAAVNRTARATLRSALQSVPFEQLRSPRWDRLNEVSVPGLKWWVPSEQ